MSKYDHVFLFYSAFIITLLFELDIALVHATLFLLLRSHWALGVGGDYLTELFFLF